MFKQNSREILTRFRNFINNNIAVFKYILIKQASNYITVSKNLGEKEYKSKTKEVKIPNFVFELEIILELTIYQYFPLKRKYFLALPIKYAWKQ